MTENNSIPESAPDTTTPEPAGPRPSRTRTLLIAGGAVVAAAVLAGGGIAVGTAIADEMDDGDRSAASSATDDTDDDTDDTDDTDDSADAGSSADLGTDSADELNDLIAAAAGSADGDAVGIEANRDGSWDVEFETSTGNETEVRVTTDGAAEVRSKEAADADDSASLGVLDTATVDALVAAALAEVDGKVTDIEIGSDTASPFDVSVIQPDGRTIELELDADLKVLSSSAS